MFEERMNIDQEDSMQHATWTCAVAIVSLVALTFRAFGNNMLRISRILMRSLMCHKDQKSVCAVVLAIVKEASRPRGIMHICPHRPSLAVWMQRVSSSSSSSSPYGCHNQLQPNPKLEQPISL